MFNLYPYLNVNDLNLDYILKTLKTLVNEVENFVSLNAIKYADPIQWVITRQYEKNTVVIDPLTGTAYISVAPVPIGVQLNRPEYWTVVFDLGSFVVRAAKNFTPNYEDETTTAATISLNAGDLVVWGDTLYIANVNITPGDTFVPGGNISQITVEDITGHLIDLTTTDKTNLVNAINELVSSLTAITTLIGDLNDLNTVDKTSVVNAINEVLTDMGNAITGITTIIGDLNNLNTVDKTSVVNAINEVLTDIGDLNDLNTVDKTSVVNAINEVLTDIGNVITSIGDLNDLNTLDKTSVVNAINEVLTTAGKVKNFNTVADMIAADLSDGMLAITAGYYGVNDNGGAIYSIKSVAPSTYYETLSNGLYAELIVTDPVNIKTLGAHGDDTNDDSTILQYALTNYDNIYIPAGTYLINNACTVAHGKSFMLSGDGKATVLHGQNILIIESSAEQLSIIENLQFYNDSNAVSGEAIHLGTANGGAGNLTIRNCYFLYCYYAIRLDTEVDSFHVEDCYFYRSAAGSIFCNNANSTHSGFYVDGCHFQAAKDGAREVNLTKMINASITNSIFEAATRTNLQYVRFLNSYNIIIENTYYEILGTTSPNTNKAIYTQSCNDVTIHNIELSGNIGGAVLWPSKKTVFDFYLSKRIKVTGVKYTHNLVDCLMAISSCESVYCDYVSDTIPTTYQDYVRDMHEMVNLDGKILRRTQPACIKSGVNVANGGALSIALNTEALGFSADTVYMVTVAATPGNGCASYLFYGQTLTPIATITNVDVTNTGNTLTVTNNTGAVITKLFFSVHSLTA